MKAVWLIDMGYITKASKGRGRVDYIATRDFLQQRLKCDVLPIIFNSFDTFGVELKLNQFYYTVKKAGFLVNLYKMEGGAQKQVDVAIGAHLVYYALKDHQVILSSGDIDFLPAIQLVKTDNSAATVRLLTYDFGVHQELSAICDEHILFDQHPQTILASR
jgi:uncharacterized LabA/DUF88 family protein